MGPGRNKSCGFRVKVCGSVELSSGQSSATLGFKDEQGRITEHVVDGSGRFCVMVPPAKYTVEVSRLVW